MRRIPERDWVNLCIEACMGWLIVTLEIRNSSLTLPAGHPKVRTSTSEGTLGSRSQQYRHFESRAVSEGRFQVTEIIGGHFEIGAYATVADDHNNAITWGLLRCFDRADRLHIIKALDQLAADRSAWWEETLALRAAELNKTVDELTDEDLGPLLTRGGQRNYPLFKRTAEHNTYPRFRVNRRYLEAELTILLDRLLSEASVAR